MDIPVPQRMEGIMVVTPQDGAQPVSPRPRKKARRRKNSYLKSWRTGEVLPMVVLAGLDTWDLVLASRAFWSRVCFSYLSALNS